MAGLGKKPPAYATKEAAAYLDQLSKAALIDIIWDCAVRMQGEDKVNVRFIRDILAEPILRLRGDREVGNG